ncbi:MAG: C69 family dipeptidase [Planctomycetia bacterium]|nr:C69 family dipeptidase [Planctomycetia bacterium]
MCDTLVIVRKDKVWFAKNSDRDPNEAQALDWQPAQNHAPGSTLQCTHISIPQVIHTHAVLLSRPFWMWGAEMGANEHGVCIGNEAVFTNQPYRATGLTGMDLVRLGLERSRTAQEALDVIIQLLQLHGQGGGCGYDHPAFTYHNSFLIADTETAFVLETAGDKWVSEKIQGVRSISNGLSIPSFAQKYQDKIRTRVARAAIRQSRTCHLGQQVSKTDDLFAILRDHGHDGLKYSWISGALSGPCAHAGGMLAATQTTASWVSELSSKGCRHWATATSNPCLSIFKPVSVAMPLEIGSWPQHLPASDCYWWRHERLFRVGMPVNSAYQIERDQIELRLMLESQPSVEAFNQAEEWILQQPFQKQVNLPWYVKWYWQKQNKKAGCLHPA